MGLFFSFGLIGVLLSVSPQDVQKIGEKVWQNECAGSKEKLTHWNKGENFASFGIGHFIWYSKDKREKFQETFPELIAYLESKGASIPVWLKNAKACPWNSREEFYNKFQSQEMQTLRQFLYDTKTLQANFITDRFESAFKKILEKCQFPQLEKMRKNFSSLLKDPKGIFAMIDYLNFKGSGASPLETYKGEGWGLLQVLQAMPANSDKPVEDFVRSAKEVLDRRVKNSPPERNESQWLKGWYNRLDSYLN